MALRCCKVCGQFYDNTGGKTCCLEYAEPSSNIEDLRHAKTCPKSNPNSLQDCNCDSIKTITPVKSCMEAQQGGNHYQQGGIQPIQYIHANKLNFFEGNCIKYVTRNRRKGTPTEDLKKAIHYLQLSLKLDHGIDSNIEYTQCNTLE